MLLPADPSISPGGAILEEAPLSFWIPALEHLRRRHALPAGSWRRFERGKNAVFELGTDWIVKLAPPCWIGDAQNEAEALRLVEGHVHFQTPELVACDTLDGWLALVMRRLDGVPLYTLWAGLEREAKVALARQMGEAAAAFRRVPVPERSGLRWDWPGQLRMQRESVMERLREGGAPAHLLDEWPAFLDDVGPLPTPGAPDVFLHGDLAAANVMVREQDGGWSLTGILDFGDVSTGEATHEFLSPGVHTFRGDREVLAAFYDGYGLAPGERTRALQNHLMARTVLYYDWGYLKWTGVAERHDSWEVVAEQFWRMTG